MDAGTEAAVLMIAEFATAAGLIAMAVFSIQCAAWGWRNIRSLL